MEVCRAKEVALAYQTSIPDRRETLKRTMQYELFISEKARTQLRDLEEIVRRQIGQRIEVMRDDLRGDVRKLEGKSNRYRLRVGRYRVLFTLERNLIAIYAVKDRKEAYE